MTNNHLELCGVETRLRLLVDRLNMTIREGTLRGIADVLSDINWAATDAGFKVNDILFNETRSRRS